MAKNIEPKLRKIGDYLKISKDAVFVIPEYQRAYSWEIFRCDKLWQDIMDYLDKPMQDSHFFGTIIISCEDNDRKLELIDGQQRTTTFLLILKALLMHINTAIPKTPSDDDSANLLRGLRARRRKIMELLYRADEDYITDNPDDDKDKAHYNAPLILVNHSNNERHSSDFEQILKAATFKEAESNITPIKYKKGDNKYSIFFRNFKFFYNKIAELTSSQINGFAKTLTDNCEVIEIKSWQVDQAINMFNSLNSDGLPLYDSDIIYSKLYAAASSLGIAPDLSKLWHELTTEIEWLEEMGIADLNALLMQYMYYIRAAKREIINASGTVDVTTPGLRRYFTQINTAPLTQPIETCKNLLKLAKTWRTTFAFPAIKVLLKFNENAKLFLATYLLRLDEAELTQDNVEPIAESLLRLFSILELVDIGYSSKNFKMFLFKEEVKLSDKNVTAETIVKDFVDHIHKNWDEKTIESAAKEYDGNMLVYLNELLFSKEKKISFDLDVKHDIEHIMPQSGKNEPEIRRDADIADDDEFRAFVNKLGNKIVLEGKINRGVGNEWFRTKVSTRLHEKTGYIDSIYPIATHLVDTYKSVSKPYWTKTDISAATEKASSRIAKFIFTNPAESPN